MPEIRACNPQLVEAITLLQSGVDTERNFRCIFEFYYRAVHAFFRRKTFSAAEADELTQETFFRVYHKIEQFRGDAPFEAWLWQIASNQYRKKIAARQTHKRAGNEVSLDDDDAVSIRQPESPQPSPLETFLESEKSAQLRAAIEALPEQMRNCMKLRVFQDLSYQEIAVIMRISPQTVKAHLFQARKNLRERLGEYFEGAEI
jgi:RNA polymerase sigma-70 factor (ECF subfamily)